MVLKIRVIRLAYLIDIRHLKLKLMATLRFMRPGTHLNLILYMGGLKMQDLKIGDQKR